MRRYSYGLRIPATEMHSEHAECARLWQLCITGRYAQPEFEAR